MNGGNVSNFDERLAAAASKPRPHADVSVCLDQDAAEERDRLVAAIATAKQEDAEDMRLTAPDVHAAPVQAALEALSDTLRDSIVTLRFVQLPGDKWAALTAMHRARPESELDMAFGYNLDGVVRAAAQYTNPDTGERYAFRLEDGEAVSLTDEQIATLWPTLAGSEVSAIRDAVWGLNDFGPSQRIEALVKGFGAATRSDTK